MKQCQALSRPSASTFTNQKLLLSKSCYIKSCAKKIGHVFCSADQEISLLALKWIRKGQNNLFQALKWGIVRLSSSNWSRDMTKHKNAMISKFPDFERKIRQILQNSKNWRNNIFMFIDVSLKIFKLQRSTIPHFKAYDQ